MVNLSQVTVLSSLGLSLGYTTDEGFIADQGPLLLEEVGLEKVADHGCWCSRLGTSQNSDNGHLGTLDGLDLLCKQWFQARRCLTLEGGSCHDITANGYTFNSNRVLPDNTGNPVSNCRKDKWENSACGEDTCVVDAYYVEQIFEAVMEKVTNHADFEPNTDINTCEQITPVARENLVCEGIAPNLKVVEDINWQITIHPEVSGYGKIYWLLTDKTTGLESKVWVSDENNGNAGARGSFFSAGDVIEGYIDLEKYDIRWLRARYPNGSDQPLLFKADGPDGLNYRFRSADNTRTHDWTWLMKGSCDISTGAGCPVISDPVGAYALDNHCDDQERCSLKPE